MDLWVEDLTFGYDGSRSVLKHVSFRVPTGTTMAVVGPSGCGKSTLLRLICRILPASRTQTMSGMIHLGDSNDIGSLTRLGQIGFIFQEPNLLPHLTVRENIRLPLEVIGDAANRESFVERLLESVGLGDSGGLLPRALSTGMKTRAMLARTFSTRPRILLLDEPFSSLDIGWKIVLYQILQNLRKASPSTTLIVTHDIQEALLLGDRIIVFSGSGSVIREVALDSPRPSSFDAETINSYLASVLDTYLSIQEDLVKDGAERGEQNPFLGIGNNQSSRAAASR